MYRYYVVELVALGHCKDDSMVHNSLAAGKKPLHDISRGTLTLVRRDNMESSCHPCLQFAVAG